MTEAAPDFTAVMVTVSPFTAPAGVADIVGVESVVTLSVFDEPVSEDDARSGVAGADGEVVSTETGRASDVPVLPARSVTAADTLHVPSANVPSVHEVDAPTV